MNVPVDRILHHDAAVNLRLAEVQVERAIRGKIVRPVVRTFFDESTYTATNVVHDLATKAAAIVDSVMDFDEAAGRTSFEGADRIIDYVKTAGRTVEWLLDVPVPRLQGSRSR